MRIVTNGVFLEAHVGDIAQQPGIAAVVNAANAELMPGGGVAGAIHAAAGPELATVCAPLAPIAPGEAAITPAFDLPNEKIIHCLGPVYGHDRPEAEILESCYRSSLELAEENMLASVATPAISTGAFGYPIDEAAEIACRTVAAMTAGLRHVQVVRFVLYSQKDYDVFARELVRAAAHARQNGEAAA
ncbi:macro domain-containing protein [Lutibaculum baratangense]|uniref:Putative ADP-ribose binding domain-containing protein n=1 Tax=Lutibaculum baratangense AMV1 TaxID=631454 RepID=V4RQN0_9HYPH|nr:macro domain-containing protein [Lutibaculum baratangense]ESR25430.1 putative ADP-ribose binding domain-containing protein [Lutibaculum baratangense AMV1]